MNEVPCPWCDQPISRENAERIEKKIDEKNKKQYESDLNELTLQKDNELNKKIETNNQKYEEIIKNNDDSHQTDLHNLELQIESEAKKKAELLMTKSNEIQDEHSRSQQIQINNLTKTNDEQRATLFRKEKEIEKFIKTTETRQIHQKGSDGEGILLDRLQKEFKTDRFETQISGKGVADISQTIIINNKLCDTKICFDNKEKTGIVSSDYDKAKRYMNEHNTEHVIIVSSKLPAEFGSNFIGIKNGVIICHPDIILIITHIIRDHIIQMESIAITSVDPHEKSIKLYDYLMNNTFDLQMRTLCNCIVELQRLQRDEIQKSETRWTKQTVQFKTLEHSLLEIITNIETISGKKFTNDFLTLLKQS